MTERKLFNIADMQTAKIPERDSARAYSLVSVLNGSENPNRLIDKNLQRGYRLEYNSDGSLFTLPPYYPGVKHHVLMSIDKEQLLKQINQERQLSNKDAT
jgi:hypothetical protein